ncbi:unnamed protein product [Clonostachys rosea]|uniref:Nuclear speckle splicing regulatory protein 1 N-terminal domain-containing protein n=1 Tax=Bionectria ochroleuca TaxID=29856 RepID=A0ABY6TSN4_BIOOC|nr:unnamed protein product [Clonostachys rosea]
MSKPLAFGLSLAKKPGASKPAPPKRKPVFGGNDDSDDEGPTSAKGNGSMKVQQIGGDLDDFGAAPTRDEPKKTTKKKNGPPKEPPRLKSKGATGDEFGDLSTALTSRKNAEAAAELDPSIYEFDSVYDSIKPKKVAVKEDEERRPKYMRNLLQAAEVRKRDQLIAEEKKIAREREEEGEEYAGKEKFVTEAYRKQQEENKRIEEEERRREEEEAKKNQSGGMSAFYRNLLNKDEQRHAQAVKAAEDIAKDGPKETEATEQEEVSHEKQEADRAKALNEKGASIALNEDGQVVDKRQLLKGGLNLGAKKKAPPRKDDERPAERERRHMNGVQVGNKQAMRERQSRMLAEQLEMSMKRSREEAEAQRQEVERASKSQKTEGEISSARERYLARKRAAAEEKSKST